MAYLISPKVHRKRLLQKLGIAFFVLGAIVCSGVIAFAGRNSGGATLKTENPDKAKSTQAMVTVFKSKENQEIGSLLNSRDFESYKMTLDLVTEDTVRDISELKDKRLAKSIMKNEILKKSNLVGKDFFFKQEDRLIEQAFSPEGIPSDCKEGSIIDIRLFKLTGNDPVVISKVFVIKRVECNLTMYMDMKEQELLKQAIKEGSLYILIYADPNQEASIVDYLPNYSAGGRDDKWQNNSSF